MDIPTALCCNVSNTTRRTTSELNSRMEVNPFLKFNEYWCDEEWSFKKGKEDCIKVRD